MADRWIYAGWMIMRLGSIGFMRQTRKSCIGTGRHRPQRTVLTDNAADRAQDTGA
jgi:hypothetical protein